MIFFKKKLGLIKKEMKREKKKRNKEKTGKKSK